MLTQEQRDKIKNFFIETNDKIFKLNDRCKIFTCDRSIEGLFAVWYNECIINNCHVLFERKPIPCKSDYITNIIIEEGQKLELISNIAKDGAIIKVIAPKEIKHDVVVTMSDNLINYVAKHHIYEF